MLVAALLVLVAALLVLVAAAMVLVAAQRRWSLVLPLQLVAALWSALICLPAW